MIARDLTGGLAATAIGAVYLVFASRLRASMLDDTVGPDGMPRTYGWLLICLGVLLAGSALLRRLNAAHTRVDAATDQSKATDAVGMKILRAGGMLAFGIAYVLLVETLGYPLAIALLLIGVALYMGERPGIRVLLIGIGGALALWLMFAQLLGVAMPLGFFGR